ncbi:His-Xaa-Ser system radical SAM maturase HxsB [Methylacidimicrobium tartarophylax]|uniref:Anaerobic sulfatase-maturating enzyme n=1 Tax=Methylacidimicrobium tartarophylax TaxID=1041768 RepID=A0A5E6MNS2_9BACT|nr:His-Xaa-Ser system radical SAM maturase HxsB [Methylacidimicrobium tartarophylax]VVM07096.1 Anaerobic sulfatase-maturating enzyme [Methylacidimicrobium tartarophylax]
MDAQAQQLSRRFSAEAGYPRPGSYRLLPLNFMAAAAGDTRRYIVSNICGDYAVVRRDTLEALVSGNLSSASPEYELLRRKHLIFDDATRSTLNLVAAKYRTRTRSVANFTGLFLFVVTLRCNHVCPYCQVSRVSEDREAFDMTEEMAEKALDFTFRTPSSGIKIEFQGGEPMLNFPLIQFIVQRAKAKNRAAGKDLQFVAATNLSVATDQMLKFCAEEEILLSTSLDGPADLHNANRPKRGNNSYELTIEGIRKARKAIGHHRVGALMTTTEKSLHRVRDIVDTYVAHDFHQIFLRPLSPYGDAIRTKAFDRYTAERWVEFYKEGLDYILDRNKRGYPMKEAYASILLTRILTNHGTGFVNLQSPAGIGIAGIVFNYDGDVYASDEGRMAAERGDKTFRLGNILSNSYEEIMLSDSLLEPLAASLLESAPMCHECAFLPYCGADPDYHHATQGDFLGHKAFSGFCAKNMEIFRHLIGKLEAGGEDADILRSWT